MSRSRSCRLCLLFVCLALGALPVFARSSRDAPVPPQGRLCQDLFRAIDRGDLPRVRAVLARGADPNARNSLQLAPLCLAAASGQERVAEALLRAGAKLEASTPYGTALTFAAMSGQTPMMKLLLARGAHSDPQRPDGITVLMMAASSGDPAIIRDLLSRKAAVNAKDSDGATALIYAARKGHLEVGRILLSRCADFDGADSHRWTPLMYAAVNGHAEFVRLLLEKGAQPDARDDKGRTPLILAATCGDHPAVIRALLDGGADLRATDARKRTASALATTRGHGASAAVLRRHDADTSPVAVSALQRNPKEAVQASLTLLQRSMQVFTQNTGCVSCHHHGLGRMVTGAARTYGFAIDRTVARAQAKRISEALTALRPVHLRAVKDPGALKDVPLSEIGEVTPSYAFMLAGMVAHRQPANQAVSPAALVLARQQFADGHWQFSVPRVPQQSSYFTMTALAIRTMRAYAHRDRAAEVAERLRRARAWLLKTPTKNSEDQAFGLLALKWAGASREERRAAIEALRAEQRPDGGWSQLTSLWSDAYATGQALYALHVGGELSVTDPAYQRGVQFLLRTQEEDGSWFVNKRATPLNNYFDAAFPHGQSQYASFNATCWATMALLQTIDAPRPRPRHVARRNARVGSPRSAGLAHR